MKYLLVALLLVASLQRGYSQSFENVEDGRYDAEVTTPSGTYTVPVEVSGGEVECVRWPNGGCMSLNGADVEDDGSATGYNARGDTIEVQLEE
jgi:hypothetical protein